MRWAVFDVDGTILPGTSMERLLFAALIWEGLIPVRSFFIFIFFSLQSFFQGGGIPEFLENKRYFRDLPDEPMARFSRRLVEKKVLPRIPDAVYGEMERLRKNGYKILLMSGAPEFLLSPLAEFLGADAAAGTVLETASGRLTGNSRGGHVYGPVKADVLRNHRKELDLDFPGSVVYANASSDTDHMRLFGTAVAVNPRRGLRRTAGECGWRIVKW
jgi:HAD superfamily phosphoserine phosphatase-like hydrolase